MTAAMGANRYGKDGIRLVLVRRAADRHELRDLTVDVRLAGDFDRVHTEGDNSPVLPTDTMRSTVYALAQSHLTGSIEDFGGALCARFLAAAPAATEAEVHVVEHGWSRVETAGAVHPWTFVGAAGAATATVTTRRDGAPEVTGGLTGLTLLKTTGSAFSGFLRDEYTVLAETEDRIMASDVSATWRWTDATVAEHDGTRSAARDALVTAFAEHDSASVQHTLHAMGSAVLDACPGMASVWLRMPNKHHVAVDLAPFGIENDRAVFVATDRPFGVIEGEVRRS